MVSLLLATKVDVYRVCPSGCTFTKTGKVLVLDTFLPLRIPECMDSMDWTHCSLEVSIKPCILQRGEL
ncbi:hypothetical protein CesoFtcFv8_013034 [Champsocephalus esox]|uniref:Uncharacterized protein n=1 Tax=Champsocephalus esox TaxID=159716 RepID=A0AAN8BYT8_9TELE|nr:hypothetical protein CesoFtcFv8_013034 [Champsocephalus esox]